MADVTIEKWQAGNAEHAKAFADINRGWVEEFFTVEPEDAAMFDDPQVKLIDKGGMIFFARLNGKIVGVIGLLKMNDEVYELSKMGVVPGMRGKGIGRKLGQALIDYARSIGVKKLYIASNRKLEQAIILYKSLGFVETAAGQDERYKRANITLEMPLTLAEVGGRQGLDPTRYGDWEKAGKCVDF